MLIMIWTRIRKFTPQIYFIFPALQLASGFGTLIADELSELLSHQHQTTTNRNKKLVKNLFKGVYWSQQNFSWFLIRIAFFKIMINKRTDDIVEKAPLVRKTRSKLDCDSLSEIASKSVPEVVIDLCSKLRQNEHVVVGDSRFGNLGVSTELRKNGVDSILNYVCPGRALVHSSWKTLFTKKTLWDDSLCRTGLHNQCTFTNIRYCIKNTIFYWGIEINGSILLNRLLNKSFNQIIRKKYLDIPVLFIITSYDQSSINLQSLRQMCAHDVRNGLMQVLRTYWEFAPSWSELSLLRYLR